jgi:hypothetical protein
LRNAIGQELFAGANSGLLKTKPVDQRYIEAVPAEMR